MQRAEIEEMRQRDANLTALQAIGPRKKPKLEGDATGTSAVSFIYLFIIISQEYFIIVWNMELKFFGLFIFFFIK